MIHQLGTLLARREATKFSMIPFWNTRPRSASWCSWQNDERWNFTRLYECKAPRSPRASTYVVASVGMLHSAPNEAVTWSWNRSHIPGLALGISFLWQFPNVKTKKCYCFSRSNHFLGSPVRWLSKARDQARVSHIIRSLSPRI